MESFIPHLKSYYQKELVESPPAFEGEIKIRLFITPILFFIGRGRSQTVNCQAVNCQLLKALYLG
ncbi:MAG: hypothetical protein EAZ90_25110 [Oscillatoriales cyanobacterium]|nr:MAG: hypothetical protein EAZ94_28105 [Oscillatoriales cyanobacterium]TAE18683.1 MAG: hypothetical protein EAZ93_28985 [Oscillatoriales cyanobacterium]TAE38377.1 MAG: hypothetical protein EAZ90_25110 [Oscillatoriales cyanobacterium]TAE53976.1 MAG: hypothetical protein EAZ88_10320 [Oscillatoriales cyanobacterium]TAE65331.1 MAG: hypothetical protein EAZ86_24850 [Oscillatoriales cyanobacterium]